LKTQLFVLIKALTILCRPLLLISVLTFWQVLYYGILYWGVRSRPNTYRDILNLSKEKFRLQFPFSTSFINSCFIKLLFPLHSNLRFWVLAFWPKKVLFKAKINIFLTFMIFKFLVRTQQCKESLISLLFFPWKYINKTTLKNRIL